MKTLNFILFGLAKVAFLNNKKIFDEISNGKNFNCQFFNFNWKSL